MNLPVLITGLVLGLIHLFAGKVRFLDVIPRSRWLSLSGGVAVAYICVHVLPELHPAQGEVQQRFQLLSINKHVYLSVLLGLAAFYSLERLAKHSRRQNRERRHEDSTSRPVFLLHLLAFLAYNLVIGYYLGDRGQKDWQSLLFFATAIGLHFVGNDYALRQDHKQAYHQFGRWVLSLGVLTGCIASIYFKWNEAILAMLFSFVSGGIILNVLKEELPEERESSFPSFLLGAAGFGILLAFSDA